MAGTDILKPLVGPGDSLHRELRLLAACGLTTEEVSRSATARAAELLGRGHGQGTVEVGKLADIVVISGDRVRDLSTDRIVLLMRGGETVFDRDDGVGRASAE